jgi:hypothetical protein
MVKAEQEFIGQLISVSELFRVLSVYIANTAKLEFKNPELKQFNKFMRENPEKITEILEKIYEHDPKLGKELMLIMVKISALNTKLSNINLLGYEEKLSVAKELDDISIRIKTLKKLVKKLRW